MTPSFDLNLLPIAVALYEERSATLAARRLGMSQSAVSKALARLRTALGDQLFIKTARGMEPTARATSLVGPARDVLERVQWNVLSGNTFDPAVTDTTFTCAFSEVSELLFLPKLMKRLRTLAPHASIISLLPSVEELQDALESGEIDLAIGIYPEIRKHNFFQQRLLVSDVACLLRANHPIRGDRLSVHQYLDLDHVVVRAGHTSRIVEQVFRTEKLRRNIALVISHYLSLPEIITHTDLVASVARPLADYFSRTNTNVKVVTAPPEIPQLELQQLWHRKFHDDPKNKWLRGIVKELFYNARTT